jgi:CO/xanthine dehydrogenase FAD-binding subunit
MNCGWGFEEFARRAGDYAIAGCAAIVRIDESGLCEDARLVYFSVGEVPLLAAHAALALVGEQPTQERIAEAALNAATLDIDPTGDIHASADYRRHLAQVLARRVLAQAFARAVAGVPT